MCSPQQYSSLGPQSMHPNLSKEHTMSTTQAFIVFKLYIGKALAVLSKNGEVSIHQRHNSIKCFPEFIEIMTKSEQRKELMQINNNQQNESNPCQECNIPKSFSVIGGIKYSKMDFYFKMQLVLFQERRSREFLLCTAVCLQALKHLPTPHRDPLACYCLHDAVWKITQK